MEKEGSRKTSQKNTRSVEKKAVVPKKSHSEKKSTPKAKKKTLSEEEVMMFKKHRLKHHAYVGYWGRVIINALMFTVFAVCCFWFATKTIERKETKPITYSDLNQISYKVYLKPNDFYKEEYLDMNRAYVASLIDHIDIDYHYLFNIDCLTSMDFDYKIIAELIIENAKGVNYVDEKYIIRDTETKRIENSGAFDLNQHVIIDYSYYNYLANKFKTETGVDITSYLNVYLEVKKKTDSNLNYSIKEQTKANIKIPLSERALEINFDANSLEASKHVSPTTETIFNPHYFVVEVCLFMTATIFLVYTINYLCLLFQEQTAYDKYVNKILKSYDRLVVETKTNIDFSKCHVTNVKSFTELLDVRDNLKLPIMYYNITKHEKGVFYIKNNNDVFSYVVKGVDLKK